MRLCCIFHYCWHVLFSVIKVHLHRAPIFHLHPSQDPVDMPQSSSLLVMVAVGAVAIVLVLGLFNMLRGGSPNRSQTFMRWRVGLQFLAIIVIMGVLWTRS